MKKLLFSLLFSSSLFATWAEETLSHMTTQEKIGQLFMVAGYLDREFAEKETGNSQMIEEIDTYIQKYHIGGIAYVGPSESLPQAKLTHHYQSLSSSPLLIAQDLEWGLGMRLKDGISFPKNIVLGAIPDNDLIYQMGREIGREAKAIGVHMNLSPVLDVNIEPDNLAINGRSFGDTPSLVAEKGIAMIQGLQDEGIIASAKHFPGLGRIQTDPHLGLPFVDQEIDEWQKVEFYPFAKAIEAGVLSIQLEHVMAPAIDPDLPASLSPRFVTDILKKQLHFEGLILSGALRMKALALHFPPQEIARKAFLAGSDILLMPEDLKAAYEAIETALNEGVITEEELDLRVLKILKAKEQLGLHKNRLAPLPTPKMVRSPFALELKKALYQSAVSFLRHPQTLAPGQKIAYFQLGESPSTKMLDLLKETFAVDIYQDTSSLLRQAEKYDRIILAVYPLDPRRIVEIRLLEKETQSHALASFKVHGIPPDFLRSTEQLLAIQEKIVLVYFGNPYGLPFFEGFSSLLMAYDGDPDAQTAAYQLLWNKAINRD